MFSFEKCLSISLAYSEKKVLNVSKLELSYLYKIRIIPMLHSVVKLNDMVYLKGLLVLDLFLLKMRENSMYHG
jgi:hypothetical protein